MQKQCGSLEIGSCQAGRGYLFHGEGLEAGASVTHAWTSQAEQRRNRPTSLEQVSFDYNVSPNERSCIWEISVLIIKS